MDEDLLDYLRFQFESLDSLETGFRSRREERLEEIVGGILEVLTSMSTDSYLPLSEG